MILLTIIFCAISSVCCGIAIAVVIIKYWIPKKIFLLQEENSNYIIEINKLKDRYDRLRRNFRVVQKSNKRLSKG